MLRPLANGQGSASGSMDGGNRKAVDSQRSHVRVDGARTPWSIAELNRLLGIARKLPDELLHPSSATDGIVARVWWPAFINVQLETRRGISSVLGLAPGDFDRGAGRLACGRLILSLHPLTVEALSLLPTDSGQQPAQLLPWRLDRGPLAVLHVDSCL